MKNSIIELANGNKYYVLEELVLNERTYVFGSLCDLEKDTIDTENFVIMEIQNENNNIIVEEIQDDILAQEVLELFQEKFQSQE